VNVGDGRGIRNRGNLQFGDHRGIVHAGAFALLGGKIRVLHRELHAFAEALGASAIKIGDVFGDVLHAENRVQVWIFRAGNQRSDIGARGG